MPSPEQQDPMQEVLPAPNAIFQQDSFAGGMNQQVDPTRLLTNEYPLGVNIRTRYGVVELVNLPEDADPQGSLTGRFIQHIASAGPYFLVIADGKAFYRNILNNDSAFTQIAGFQLSPVATAIYVELVPASSMNFGRKLIEADDVSGGVALFSSTQGSPQCLVCQDGETQPWLIFEDGTARQSNAYNQWTTENREYVPVGRQMMYLNGILYIVGDITIGSAVSQGRQIFRSVQGRPLDFVVNINSAGEKGGDASTTSFAVDYDPITCIARVNAASGGFFVSTAKNSYLVVPDYTAPLPFNQPRYNTQFLFNTGPINQFSLCEKTGDVCFIDFGGIRSFNAVLQDKNEGRNQPFSKKVTLLFATLTQNVTAAMTFDDYTMFAVDTIYGPGILVYDNIQECWVGLDMYDNFEEDEYVSQFCEVKVGATRRLFVRTSSNNIYELFAGTEYATGRIYLGDWCSNDVRTEIQPQTLKCVFTDIVTATTVSVLPFMDRKAFAVKSLPLQSNTDAFSVPMQLPFGPSSSDTSRNINFALEDVDVGWKAGFFISWNKEAQLTHVRLEARKVDLMESSDEQAATLYS